MKRFVPFVLVFGLIAGLSCSSDESVKAASMTTSAEAPAATDGSDTVDLTMQSDLDDLEERIEQRIQELEDQLANLPAGPQGPAGPAGADGPAGAQGPAGPAGADGADGNDGATGPAGPAGADGAQGPAGANGTDGTDGATGADGAAGATGADGAAGATGAVGATGAAGADGVAHDLTCADGQVPILDNNDWSCGTLTESRGATLYHPGIAINCCNGNVIFSGATTLSSNLSFDTFGGICDSSQCYLDLTDVTDHTGCFVTGSYGSHSIEAAIIETAQDYVRLRFFATATSLDVGDSVYFNIDCGRTYTIDAD